MGTPHKATPEQWRILQDDGGTESQARAVILAVAAWLEQRTYVIANERTCVIANGSQWAERLREEAHRHG